MDALVGSCLEPHSDVPCLVHRRGLPMLAGSIQVSVPSHDQSFRRPYKQAPGTSACWPTPPPSSTPALKTIPRILGFRSSIFCCVLFSHPCALMLVVTLIRGLHVRLSSCLFRQPGADPTARRMNMSSTCYFVKSRVERARSGDKDCNLFVSRMYSATSYEIISLWVSHGDSIGGQINTILRATTHGSKPSSMHKAAKETR